MTRNAFIFSGFLLMSYSFYGLTKTVKESVETNNETIRLLNKTIGYQFEILNNPNCQEFKPQIKNNYEGFMGQTKEPQPDWNMVYGE